MRYLCLFLLTLTIAVPGGAQDPAPDPHEGQVSYCVNHGGFEKEFPMVEPHICNCERMEDGSEDRKCLTWCRRPNCKCIHEIEREPPPQ